jgi:putative ABC transport system permease protein
VKYTDPDNFWISTAEQMVEEFHNVTAMVALVMIVLSSIGLLVGGIGVMNIMLVSVTERTREIGIRKAIGATKFDIVLQFLTEAATLTFIGGLLGMMFGWGISFAARLVFPSLTTQVPIWAALLGVGEDLIGLVDLDELDLGLGIARVLVRMPLHGELPEARLEFALGCRPLDA